MWIIQLFIIISYLFKITTSLRLNNMKKNILALMMVKIRIQKKSGNNKESTQKIKYFKRWKFFFQC